MPDLLNYNPDERITPVPTSVVVYSPQMPRGQTFQSPMYVPITLSSSSCLSVRSPVTLVPTRFQGMAGQMQTQAFYSQVQPQGDASTFQAQCMATLTQPLCSISLVQYQTDATAVQAPDVPMPLPTPVTRSPFQPQVALENGLDTSFETDLHFGSTRTAELLPDAKRTAPLSFGNPPPSTTDTNTVQVEDINPISSLVDEVVIPTTTATRAQAAESGTEAEPTASPSVPNTPGISGPTSDASLEVAKAIREMSTSLVICLENQTLQIQLMRATVSAFLRKMENQENSIRYNNFSRRRANTWTRANNFNKRRSVTPMPSPEKKRKLASTVIIPKKKK